MAGRNHTGGASAARFASQQTGRPARGWAVRPCSQPAQSCSRAGAGTVHLAGKTLHAASAQGELLAEALAEALAVAEPLPPEVLGDRLGEGLGEGEGLVSCPVAAWPDWMEHSTWQGEGWDGMRRRDAWGTQCRSRPALSNCNVNTTCRAAACRLHASSIAAFPVNPPMPALLCDAWLAWEGARQALMAAITSGKEASAEAKAESWSACLATCGAAGEGEEALDGTLSCSAECRLGSLGAVLGSRDGQVQARPVLESVPTAHCCPRSPPQGVPAAGRAWCATAGGPTCCPRCAPGTPVARRTPKCHSPGCLRRRRGCRPRSARTARLHRRGGRGNKNAWLPCTAGRQLS